MSHLREVPQSHRWLRIGLLLAGYALIMVLGHYGGQWLVQNLGFDPMNAQGASAWTVLLTGLVVYVILLALPFVPGIEISLALFAAFGASAALPIYFATMAALLISYLAGRIFALDRIAWFFDFIGLHAGSSLVRRLAPMTSRQRIETLVDIAPNRFGRFLTRYRDVALIAALNLPGNALIGGGGGIALLAGMSGLFPFGRYVFAVAVASVPIPLTMALVGRSWH